MKAKIFYNYVYCIHKRMKFFVADLLVDLGIIHNKNFFLLWIFLQQENIHLSLVFFSYVIFMTFRNLEGKNIVCVKIPGKSSSPI